MAERNFSKGIEMQNVYLRLKNKLEEGGIIAASFELRQIFGAVSGDSFYQIRLENEFTEEEIIRLEDMVDRRLSGEPLQYIIGEWEFMGLPFKVREGILIPRSETELLCEQGFDFLETRPENRRRVLDLCCGTGCIGICAAKYVRGTDVTLIDKYDIPLEVANENAKLNGVDVKIVRGDALSSPDGALGKFDLILTNPPYITAKDMKTLQKEVTYEPETALFGGEDGLDFYRSITENYVPLLTEDGALMAEIGIDEMLPVCEMFEAAGLKNVCAIKDYNDIPRVVMGFK